VTYERRLAERRALWLRARGSADGNRDAVADSAVSRPGIAMGWHVPAERLVR
jgi:hypothetical protein